MSYIILFIILIILLILISYICRVEIKKYNGSDELIHWKEGKVYSIDTIIKIVELIEKNVKLTNIAKSEKVPLNLLQNLAYIIKEKKYPNNDEFYKKINDLYDYPKKNFKDIILFDEPIAFETENGPYVLRWLSPQNTIFINIPIITKKINDLYDNFYRKYGPGAFIFRFGHVSNSESTIGKNLPNVLYV